MATQGQRRREAVAAVRKLRQEYRKTDSAGELVQRELNRLAQRKTLIGPDEIEKLARLIETYIKLAEALQKAYAILVGIINGLPR